MNEYGAVGGTIVAHVGTALKQELAGPARENDRSLSAEVRRAIREHLERDEIEEEAA
jgi:hypothetical protein